MNSFVSGTFYPPSHRKFLLMATLSFALYGCDDEDKAGGVVSAASPTPMASSKPSVTATPQASKTPQVIASTEPSEPSASPEPSPTPTTMPTMRTTPSPMATFTATQSPTPSPQPRPSATITPTPVPTPTATPIPPPTSTPLATATPAPSASPAAAGALDYKGLAAEVCDAGLTQAELQESVISSTLPAARLVATGLKGAEGPVWIASANKLYFSEIYRNAWQVGIPREDLRNASILALDPETGMVETWLENSGSNGLALAPDAKSLYMAVTPKAEIQQVRLSNKSNLTVIANKDADGKSFNAPNDLTISSSKHLYFTDPTWGSGRADDNNPAPFSTPAYWTNSAGETRVFDDDLIQPNGISLSPDEKTLYVSALKTSPDRAGGSPEPEIYAYSIDADGYPNNRRVLYKRPGNQPKRVGTDGTVVDCAGNLYTTSLGGVTVISAEGEFVKQIDVQDNQSSSSNVAFGGADMQTLFITVEQWQGPIEKRSFSVYAVDMPIKGMPY